MIFHSQKAPYWELSLLVMPKYKIALVCIKRLPVNTCLDGNKKSTPEQNNTSETWEGHLSCYRDLSPSIYPDASISLNSRANRWAWKDVLKVNLFWTFPVKVLQNQYWTFCQDLPLFVDWVWFCWAVPCCSTMSLINILGLNCRLKCFFSMSVV